jgi:hypothetical protein
MNLQATNDSQVRLHGNKLGWETWTLEEAGGGKFHICGAHGKNLGAGQDNELYMHDNKLAWETWTFEDAGGGQFYICGAHGQNLGAGQDHLVYLSEKRGACEMWKIERPGANQKASTDKVREWLEKMELGLYFGSFMDNGFDNMRRLKTMDDDDLEFDWIPGIKRGHKQDLCSLIKDMRRRYRQNQKAQQQKQQQQQASTAALPPGWAATTDPSTGTTYWYNSSTGETSWVQPQAAAHAPRRLAADMNDAASREQDATRVRDVNDASGAGGSPIPVARQVSLPSQSPANACPQGHALQQFQTRHDRYRCDECDHCASLGSTLHGCRTCDFDLCPDCVHASSVLSGEDACAVIPRVADPHAPHVVADGKSQALAMEQQSKIEALSRELNALKIHMTELASCDTTSAEHAVFRSSPNQNLNIEGDQKPKFTSYQKLDTVQHSIVCRVKNGTKFEDRHPEEKVGQRLS